MPQFYFTMLTRRFHGSQNTLFHGGETDQSRLIVSMSYSMLVLKHIFLRTTPAIEKLTCLRVKKVEAAAPWAAIAYTVGVD